MTRRLSSDTVAMHGRGQPQPGDVLGGKYRINREVGSGGMGVVYEVTHLVMTESRFAIKWLVPLADGTDAVRRFVREARIAGRIRHPHVVEVYDIHLDDSDCYMVMELLEGESLAARIERTGPLCAAQACRILLPCLSAVAAAHAAGVIHRDLKPENIFLCRTSDVNAVRPKVLDFGISRMAALPGALETTETRKGVLIGTPVYMAPEQLRAADCDERTDVYGLGVTLYEVLSGRRAFNASTYADLVVRVVTGDAPRLHSVVPDLPSGLSETVARAMHTDPAERYPTVDAFAKALQPFEQPNVHQRTVHAQPQLASRRDAPRPWLLIAAVAVSVSAALLLVWLVSRDSVAPQRALPDSQRRLTPVTSASSEVPRTEPQPTPLSIQPVAQRPIISEHTAVVEAPTQALRQPVRKTVAPALPKRKSPPVAVAPIESRLGRSPSPGQPPQPTTTTADPTDLVKPSRLPEHQPKPKVLLPGL